MRRIASYCRELVYILKNSGNLRTCTALVIHCVLFHLNNLFGSPRATVPFRATLRIAPKYKAEVLLRTFSGDLFVLFEVMSEEAYYIPEAILSRTRVNVILDCGANIGMTSLYLAARYPRAQIYSIEPDAQNFALLSLNTRAEPRITAIQGAVVGRPCPSVRLTTYREAWGNHIAGDEDGTSVRAFTIEEICKQYSLSRIDLLKMDIEGAECDVFRNGTFLDRVWFVVAELHGDYTKSDFAGDMAAHGLIVADGGTLPGVNMITARRG